MLTLNNILPCSLHPTFLFIISPVYYSFSLPLFMSRGSRVAPEGHGANMSSDTPLQMRSSRGTIKEELAQLPTFPCLSRAFRKEPRCSRECPWRSHPERRGSVLEWDHSFQPSSWGLLRAQNFHSVNSIEIWHKAFTEGNESGISDSNSNPSHEVTSILEQGEIQELQAVALT